MRSRLGMALAGRHVGVPMGLQICQSQPCQRRDPKPTPFICQVTAYTEPELPGSSPWSIRQGVTCHGNSEGDSPSPGCQQCVSLWSGWSLSLWGSCGCCPVPGKLQANPYPRLLKPPCPCSTGTRLPGADPLGTPGPDALVWGVVATCNF